MTERYDQIMSHKHGGDIYNNSGVLDFSANINFLGMSEAVKLEALRGVEESIHYPEANNCRLVHTIAGYHSLSEENVIAGNGAAEIIFGLVNMVRPRKALLLAPTFYEYEQALTGVSCLIERYVLNKEQGFILDESILQLVTSELDMLFICNPNNPTGKLVDKDLMDKLLCKCEECSVMLAVDESFLEFTELYDELTMCNYIDKTKHLFILKSLTKLYAMPGLRLGYGLCGDTDIVSKMKQNIQPWNISLPAQYAGVAALELGRDYIIKTREEVKQQREYLMMELQRLGIEIYDSSVNFLLFKTQEEFAGQCLEKNILIRDCSNFNGLGNGWYRIAVRSHKENEKLIQVFESILNK